MDLFEALKQCGYIPVTNEVPTGKVEYVVTIHKAQAVMYDTMTNTDALNHDPDVVKHLQKYLTICGYYSGAVDGVIDPGYSRTVYALQRYLADIDYYTGRFDGHLDDFSSATISAYQDWAQLPQTGHVDVKTMTHMYML